MSQNAKSLEVAVVVLGVFEQNPTTKAPSLESLWSSGVLSSTDFTKKGCVAAM